MSPTVRAATLMNFAEVSRAHGLNPLGLIRQLGLDGRVLTQPDMRLPATAVVALLEAAADASGCETFGLQMAESRRLSDFGALSLLITHQPTLREVLRTLGEYRLLVNEALTIHVEETDSTVVVREDLMVTGPRGARQAYELAVGVMVRICKSLLGQRWRPSSVNFTHSAPRDLSVHTRIFGRELAFNSDFNGVVCALADLDYANPAADPVLAGYARTFVQTLRRSDQGSVVGEVQRAIHLLLPSGQATIERVAESSGLSARTLQRRLDDQGADFRSILDDVRSDLALRFVANEAYSLTRVAQLLGYSQSSTFTRWFHAKFGLAPSQWRRSGAAGAARAARAELT